MSNCGSKKKNWSEILEPIWRGQMLSRVNEFRQSLHRKRKPKGKERSLDRGRKTWAGKKRSRVEKHEKKGTGKVTGTLGKKKRIVGVFSNLCFKLSDTRIIRGCLLLTHWCILSAAEQLTVTSPYLPSVCVSKKAHSDNAGVLASPWMCTFEYVTLIAGWCLNSGNTLQRNFSIFSG